jgi:hypothetical protein
VRHCAVRVAARRVEQLSQYVSVKINVSFIFVIVEISNFDSFRPHKSCRRGWMVVRHTH